MGVRDACVPLRMAFLEVGLRVFDALGAALRVEAGEEVEDPLLTVLQPPLEGAALVLGFLIGLFVGMGAALTGATFPHAGCPGLLETIGRALEADAGLLDMAGLAGLLTGPLRHWEALSLTEGGDKGVATCESGVFWDRHFRPR